MDRDHGGHSCRTCSVVRGPTCCSPPALLSQQESVLKMLELLGPTFTPLAGPTTSASSTLQLFPGWSGGKTGVVVVV